MLNICASLDDSAYRLPEETAVLFGGFKMTYRQLNAAACQVANGLRARGIRAGENIALSSPNVPHFLIAYYGILKAGCSVVPLNVLLKSREIAYHLADSDAAGYLCFEGSPELPMGTQGQAGFEQTASCREFILMPTDPSKNPFASESPSFETVSTSAEDTAVILYTSGTTGQPKGAELTHSNIYSNMTASRSMLGYTHQDVALVSLPLFHSFGQTVLMNAMLMAGGKLVLMPRFDAGQALELMEQEGVTVFGGVPTMYWAMLHAKQDLHCKLRVAVSGGSSLPLEVLRGFEERFGVAILEGYGLSETSPVASFNDYLSPRKPGTVGRPIWGVQMRVVDSDDNEVPQGELGELLVRGPNVMKGYYGRPEQTAQALRGGWFHTGDIGRIDEDGYFSIVDRSKDMIIRGGFNVYPREIEEVLMTHPDVSLAAIVGVPHNEYGEEVKAFVVKKEGAALTEPELVSWAKEHMAAYKYPREVEFRNALPMNATGKILKRELREQLTAK